MVDINGQMNLNVLVFRFTCVSWRASSPAASRGRAWWWGPSGAVLPQPYSELFSFSVRRPIKTVHANYWDWTHQVPGIKHCLWLYQVTFLHSHTSFMYTMATTLQMKGRWESNINVWFQFMFSQKWNCAAWLFPKQDYNVLPPNIHIHVSVTNLYIPRISMLFCCSQIGRVILGIHKSLTDTWMQDLGTIAEQLDFWEYINRIFRTV
jgi:hypothetical protein